MSKRKDYIKEIEFGQFKKELYLFEKFLFRQQIDIEVLGMLFEIRVRYIVQVSIMVREYLIFFLEFIGSLYIIGIRNVIRIIGRIVLRV